MRNNIVLASLRKYKTARRRGFRTGENLSHRALFRNNAAVDYGNMAADAFNNAHLVSYNNYRYAEFFIYFSDKA